MQPELTQSTQRSSSPTVSPGHNQSDHHGRHQQDHRASEHLPSGDSGREEHRSAHRPATKAAARAARGPEVSDPSVTRLSSASPSQSRSPVDRISEHENATSYTPKKKHGGPSFTVVQKIRNAGSKQCVVTDFPNGEYLGRRTTQPLLISYQRSSHISYHI